MRYLILPLCLLLLSCGRPLTPNEASFATAIHGSTIDTTRIRLVDGALIGSFTSQRDKRPRLTCRERILPEPTGETVTVAPAAYVINNRVHYSQDWYEDDFLPDYPKTMSLVHAMLFAHEITHIWQWQNRAKTGYSPWRSAREHHGNPDPYLFDLNTNTRFLDYGYEQQASIVEEYLCCAVLDPNAPRTHRLEKLLKGAFPLGDLPQLHSVLMPWDGVQIKGICRG